MSELHIIWYTGVLRFEGTGEGTARARSHWRTIAPSPRPNNTPTRSPTVSPTVPLDCMDKKGTFVTHTAENQPCSWLSTGNGSIKKGFNCGQDQTNEEEAAMFCQAQCSAYNGCDDLHCRDMSGTYMTHIGWTAQCSWLKTGAGEAEARAELWGRWRADPRWRGGGEFNDGAGETVSKDLWGLQRV